MSNVWLERTCWKQKLLKGPLKKIRGSCWFVFVVFYEFLAELAFFDGKYLDIFTAAQSQVVSDLQIFLFTDI